MAEIKTFDGCTVLLDDADLAWASQFSWVASRTKKRAGYYVARRVVINGRPTTSYMHREIMSAESGEHVDHINGNKADNRRENLRLCTRGENYRNQPPTSANRSGYKGVNWNGERRKWRAQIRVDGQSFWLGHYDTVEEAARAYDAGAKLHHGEFAHLNFPDEAI